MSTLEGKLAVVTGASVGIGSSIVRKLVKLGVDVVGFARRVENVEVLSRELKNERGKIYPMKVDITQDDQIERAFNWIDGNLRRPVQILVNNAGVAIAGNISECKSKDWKVMFNTNVIAVGVCISAFIKSMEKHNAIGGHIVNINSLVGHHVYEFPGYYTYTATKHALTVIGEGLRRELIKSNPYKIKISNVSPGQVSTYLFAKDDGDMAKFLSKSPMLNSDNVTDAVIFVLSQPNDVLVNNITIKASGELF